MTKKSDIMTPLIDKPILGHETNVISYFKQHTRVLIFLLIFFTLLTMNSFIVYCDSLDSIKSYSEVARDGESKSKILLERRKRWTGELEASKSNRQQQTIPAANPNFEAAFQGECGKNNNSNPCEHICLDLYDGTYECSCFYGFTLAVDGYSCAPMNRPPSTAEPSEQSRLQYKKKLQPTSPTAIYIDATTTTTIAPADTVGTNNKSSTDMVMVAGQSVTLRANALGLTSSIVQTDALSSDGSDISPAKERTSNLIGRSANDNRKLVDDLASGVKLRNIGQNTGIKASSDGEVLRRQLRLLEATAQNPQLEKEERKKRRAANSHINYPASFLIEERQQQLPPFQQPYFNANEKELTLNSVSLQRPSATTAITETTSLTVDNYENNKESASEPELEATAGTDRWLSAPDELDPSVRSIMLNNDRLLRQLASSLSKFLQLHPNSADTKRVDELEQDNNNHHHPTSVDAKRVAYEFSLLKALVRETMQDYSPLSASLPVSLPQRLTINGEINEPIELAQNRSSSVAASAIYYDKKEKVDQDEDDDDDEFLDLDRPIVSKMDPLCAFTLRLPADSQRYRNCGEHPECESGGQCEQADGAQFARCRCPVGRTGHFCQKPMQSLSEPKFSGRSYLAVPMITELELTYLRLVFRIHRPPAKHKSRSRAPSLLLYSRAKFTLLLDYMNRIELRYTSLNLPEFTNNSSSNSATRDKVKVKVTRVFGSRDAREDTWNELILTPDASLVATGKQESKEQLEDAADNRIVLVTPDRIHLADSAHSLQPNGHVNFTELFLGGLPDNPNSPNALSAIQKGSEQLADESLTVAGFTGCIKELSINGRLYNFRPDFNGDTLDGFDIAECCA